MIILNERNYNTDFSPSDYLWSDSRGNLYQVLKWLKVRGFSQALKEELADVLASLLTNEAGIQLILTSLPQEEIELVKQLVDAGPNTYIAVPKLDRFYWVQRFYMVVSYYETTSGTYHLVMPDEVREACARCLENPAGTGGYMAEEVVEQSPLYGTPEEFKQEFLMNMRGSDVPDFVIGMFRSTPAEQLVREQEIKLYKPLYGDDASASIDFAPVYTADCQWKMAADDPYAHRLLTDSVLHSVMRFNEGVYYNTYFLNIGKKVRVACCLGDAINSVYGKDVLCQKSVEPLAKSAKKLFPYLYCLINGKLNRLRDFKLTPLSINGQPKQWFIYKDIDDAGLWRTLRLMGLFFDPRCKAAHQEINMVAVDVLKDIYRSMNPYAIQKLREYLKGDLLDKLMMVCPEV